MKKGNIIDLLMYRNQLANSKTKPGEAISDELEIAIKLLIVQLRDLGPLSSTQ